MEKVSLKVTAPQIANTEATPSPADVIQKVLGKLDSFAPGNREVTGAAISQLQGLASRINPFGSASQAIRPTQGGDFNLTVCGIKLSTNETVNRLLECEPSNELLAAALSVATS